MARRFDGKSSIVTAGGGIGRATCLGFAAEGGPCAGRHMDAADGERTATLAREAVARSS
jgi:NAD(P)-dependent dehydrogenase (short-subunit alcohol dehydrogenase family)